MIVMEKTVHTPSRRARDLDIFVSSERSNTESVYEHCPATKPQIR